MERRPTGRRPTGRPLAAVTGAVVVAVGGAVACRPGRPTTPGQPGPTVTVTRTIWCQGDPTCRPVQGKRRRQVMDARDGGKGRRQGTETRDGSKWENPLSANALAA